MRVQKDGYLHCDYLDVLRLPVLTETIKRSKRIIKDSGLEFDSIAFCGMSGAVVAPALAIALKKKLIMVRKTMDKSHSSCCVEGYIDAKKYLFVDDFISLGETFRFVRKQIKEQFTNGESAKCVGIFQYREFELITEPQSSESDSVGTVIASPIVCDKTVWYSSEALEALRASLWRTTTVSDDGDEIPF